MCPSPSRGADGAARAATSLRQTGVDTVASFTLNGEALGALNSRVAEALDDLRDLVKQAKA